jgi:hypothetical protein
VIINIEEKIKELKLKIFIFELFGIMNSFLFWNFISQHNFIFLLFSLGLVFIFAYNVFIYEKHLYMIIHLKKMMNYFKDIHK